MAKGDRPRGYPKPENRVISEDMYPQLYREWARGKSTYALAIQYGVDWATMNYHLGKVRGAMRGQLRRDRDEILDELAAVRCAAWECFDKSKVPLTHDEVQKELDELASKGKASESLVYRVAKQVTRIATRDGDATWLTVILAAISEEARLCGHYEAGKIDGQAASRAGRTGYRAAGRSPEATREAMEKKICEMIMQRRAAQQAATN